MRIYKPYSLKRLDNDHFFVIPKDYRGIDFVLPLVNEELQTKKFTGHVIFDLLLSNGNNSRRFFNSFFDGRIINHKSLVKMSSVPAAYIKISNQFIKTNPDVLTKGILRSADIDKFKKMLNITE